MRLSGWRGQRGPDQRGRYRRRPAPRRSGRWPRTGALGACALLLAAGLSAGLLGARPALAAQLEECPAPGEAPGIGGTPAFTDGNIAVYAGGSFTATGSAAEAEGLVVVVGSANFAKTPGGAFNVGTVGAGSQITPPPGSDMLVVGGNVTVGAGTTLIVGAHAVGQDGTLLGGNVNSGGTVTGTVDTNHGDIVQNNPDALNPHAGFGSTLTSTSAQFAAQADTGGVSLSGSFLTLAGNGASSPQVFTVSAADLTAANAFFFTGIPAGPNGGYAPVIVNVTGGPVTMDQTFVSINGTRVDDFSSPNFGNAASALLWNFESATDVTIAGSGQTMGSLLVPTAGGTLTITASTNGRVYTNGDIVMSGGGNELHNFPWIGQSPFACEPPAPEPPTGSALVAKALTPGSPLDGDVNADGLLPRFHGTVVCALDDGGTYTETFTVRPPGSFVLAGLPLGVACTISEDVLLTDQDSPPGQYAPVDIGDFQWATPVITVNGTPTNQFTVTAESPAVQVDVELTNTLLGSFQVTKAVSGPNGGFVNTGRTFDVEYDCDNDGYTVDAGTGLGVPAPGTSTGTVTVADGQTLPPTSGGDQLYFPTGTVCSFSETTPAGDDFGGDPSFAWTTPSFSPATVTIGGASLSDAIRTVTVTNNYLQSTGGFTIAKTVAGDPGGTVTRFTGTWTCSAADTAGDASGIWNLADGETVALDGFPVGATCSVAEDPLTDPAGSWATSVAPAGPFTITEGDSTNLTVTVTNTFTRALGGFRIAKEVVNGAGSTVTSFTVDWSCDAPNTGGASSGSVTLGDGDTSTPITGFPTGTVCTIFEPTITDPAGNWVSSVSDGGQVTIVEGDGTAPGDLVTVTNVFDEVLGGFTITKAVTGGTGSTVTEFTGTWTCSAADAAGESSGVWTLADGDSLTVSGFPVGTTCAIAEDPVTDPAGTWTTGLSPASVTVTNDGGVGSVTAVTATNAFDPTFGGFTIDKLVLNGTGATVTQFSVDWSCSAASATAGSSGTVTLGNGGSATLAGFPTGTVCTISEAAPVDGNGVWHTSIGPVQVTITEGDGTAPADLVTVENTFERRLGGFVITKAVTGDVGAAVATFSGTWSCTEPNADGQSSGTWTLGAGQSQTFDRFPVGATCTITHDDPADPNGTWTHTIQSNGVLVTRAGSPTAGEILVANTFAADRGGFSIHKAVRNGAGAEIEEFAVNWACSEPSDEAGQSGTLTVVDGLTDTLPGFPVGTTCSLSESPIVDRNGTWATDISPGQVTIVTGDPTAAVVTFTVTNTFTPPTPPGPPAAPGEPALPVTGYPLPRYLAAALACIALGAGLLLAASRPRRATR